MELAQAVDAWDIQPFMYLEGCWIVMRAVMELARAADVRRRGDDLAALLEGARPSDREPLRC